MAPRSHFSRRQYSGSHGKGVTRLSPHCHYPFLTCPIPRFVSNREYVGLFGRAIWASHEFERTRTKVTANMERNVSRHHTELVYLNARSYRIVHSRMWGFNRGPLSTTKRATVHTTRDTFHYPTKPGIDKITLAMAFKTPFKVFHNFGSVV
ncbi:transposable element Tcb1 transposase [Trichonephila clavipes]|nr:transposable element Tcb1 transposase [Trichonephila clavipes]